MSKLQNLLNQDNGSLSVIGSGVGIGKTTLLMALLKECFDNDKHIAVITDDDPNLWYQKFGTISVFEYHSRPFIEILGDRNYDVLILDVTRSFINRLYELTNLAKTKKMWIITSTQIATHTNGKFSYDVKAMNVADSYIYLTKKTEFNMWENIKYFLFPFLFKRPNRTVNVLKDRVGGDTSYDVKINFEKATIE